MTIHDQQAAFARDIADLIMYANHIGYTVTLGEAYRTPEQAELNEKKGIGIKSSLHCDRLAMDLNLFKNGVYLPRSEDYKELGIHWENLSEHNLWGGHFTGKLIDGNHFQRNKWKPN